MVHTIAQHRAAESRLLGHDVELGLGETGGEAVEKGLVRDDHAWLAGVGDVAGEERLVPALEGLIVHGVRFRQWRRTPKNLGVARGCGAEAGDAPGGPDGYRGRRRRGDAARRDMASAIPRHTRPSATVSKHMKI